MTPLSFTVYGSPIAQPRTKAQGFIAKNGRPMAHTYEPGKADSPARQWKHEVKAAAVRALIVSLGIEEEELKKIEPATGPIVMSILIYFPRPKNLCRKKDPPGAIPHTGKRDVDNLYKAIADTLNTVIYKDDGQIFDAHVLKFYHELDGRPRAEITIEEISAP
jgi:Holliday junction resolvase RusA-like endonuclease